MPHTDNNKELKSSYHIFTGERLILWEINFCIDANLEDLQQEYYAHISLRTAIKDYVTSK